MITKSSLPLTAVRILYGKSRFYFWVQQAKMKWNYLVILSLVMTLTLGGSGEPSSPVLAAEERQRRDQQRKNRRCAATRDPDNIHSSSCGIRLRGNWGHRWRS